ncbi:MAG: aldo/keto reductase [Synergistaceae bacterium]|nr:aldo/keto reductase [Synergistaceae bacterium]MBQ3758634.1 aldo/keto reductase [Synergistaceae bacterium]MBQ6419017.1 aldo/keto reductase [Synergistaceae bacterium]MBQ6666336.1 aldo/keto reductase [Synergistaceae bacterium]MBR0185833.1 aldo/keto reductase [Synergistaceae bacterium]
MRTLKLNNGLTIPIMGFGTYKSELESIVSALEGGYKYLDTASYYGNERDISMALEQTGVKREEVFIASKIWRSDMGYDSTIKSFSRTLENLRTDYLDVLMIHWPRPNLELREWKALDLETWRAMEDLHSKGKIRALGLSNFLPYHSENILAHCRVRPSIAQLEFHAGHTQAFALEYYRREGIQVQAWSPIGRGRVLADELIIELAGKYHVTPAQVCIRFCIQEGVMPLPKASTPERLRENLECLDFEIDDEDISRIENMPPMGWSGEHPDRERVKI